MKIGTVFGVRLYIHWTFIVFLIWIFAMNLMANRSLVASAWTILFVVTVFASIILHEFGHAFVAIRFGVKTEQITLYPVGGVALMERAMSSGFPELMIAVAGPLVNAVIAVLLLPFSDVGSLVQESLFSGVHAGNFAQHVVLANFSLAVFNLIPAFPMDGGRILRAGLSIWIGKLRATRIAAALGLILGISFLLFGLVINPMLIFIGIFIIITGQAEYDFTKSSEALNGFSVKEAMMTDFAKLDWHARISDAASALLNSQVRSFVVTADGKPVGTIDQKQILDAAEAGRVNEPIENVMSHRLLFLSVESSLSEAWTILSARAVPMVLVGNDNDVRGIIDQENLVEFLSIHRRVTVGQKHD